MELAPKTAYTFANVKKTNRSLTSSLIIKRDTIETGTVVGNDDANLVRSPILHGDGTALSPACFAEFSTPNVF